MYIEHSRKSSLTIALLQATEPSAEPDERFRPSHWCDRMYYLLSGAGLAYAAGQFNWNDKPEELAKNLVFGLAEGYGGTPFAAFEEFVTKALRQRLA